jgi:molybdenum cofactor biosynthesis enzyme MoaA
MPRGAKSLTPIGNKCNIPFYTIVVDYLGNCLLCDCDAWLPLPVGKVQDFSSIEEVLDSATAKMLQQDISDGNFMFCAVDHCGIRNHDRIKKQVTLSINIDDSCNLQCPSCRRTTVMLTSGAEYEHRLKNANTILSWLEKYEHPIHITMSGNGDPLASHIMRPIVKNFYPKDGQTFTLFTNGLLIKKQISDSMPIFDYITNFRISIDAGSKQVYEDIRRPARWQVLLDNLDYLRDVKKSHRVNLNFAIQNKNYNDIPNFVELCVQYGFCGNLHQLDDWGTWSRMAVDNADAWTLSNGVFAQHDVLDPAHPNHQLCKKIIEQHQNIPNITFSPAVQQLMNTGNQL